MSYKCGPSFLPEVVKKAADLKVALTIEYFIYDFRFSRQLIFYFTF